MNGALQPAIGITSSVKKVSHVGLGQREISMLLRCVLQFCFKSHVVGGRSDFPSKLAISGYHLGEDTSCQVPTLFNFIHVILSMFLKSYCPIPRMFLEHYPI